jgi:hypothetical protein
VLAQNPEIEAGHGSVQHVKGMVLKGSRELKSKEWGRTSPLFRGSVASENRAEVAMCREPLPAFYAQSLWRILG